MKDQCPVKQRWGKKRKSKSWGTFKHLKERLSGLYSSPWLQIPGSKRNPSLNQIWGLTGGDRLTDPVLLLAVLMLVLTGHCAVEVGTKTLRVESRD